MNFSPAPSPRNLSGPTPQPPDAPPSAPASPPKWRAGGKLLPALVILAGMAAAAWWNLGPHQQTTAGSNGGTGALRTAKVLYGKFDKTLRVSGVIGARNYAAIVAPRLGGRHGGGRTSSVGGATLSPVSTGGSELILMKLAKPGSLVKNGDVVAQFDTQWEEDHLEGHKARVVQARALVDQRKAELAIQAEAQQQSLRVARAEHDKARLEFRAAEVRTEIDREKLKLNVEETQVRVQQLEEEAELRKLSHQAELRGLEMQADEERGHVERHTRNLERMAMRASISGIVVLLPIPRPGQIGQVQEGDQVLPGAYFMQIVDLSKMVLEGTVNQADSHGVTLHQPATIRLDAYPGLVLTGRLTALGAMASSSNRGFRSGSRDIYVKQITARFAIDAHDSRVIPDLSASAEVKMKTVERALQIPLEAVMEDKGKTYASLRQDAGFQWREIQLGMRNHTHAIVAAGLSEGDAVALEK